MASIGKLAASIFSATNENTLALVNINFDFSLWKKEAPEEFRSISESLSSTRRETAENGPLHQTARRLGSLFNDVIPQTPMLLQAYGQRASEISKSIRDEPKNAKTKVSGPFDQYLGLDASTIWAGATSGNSAIAVHLLACMLARTWKGPEAISIWWELVTERKKEIERQHVVGESFSLGTLMAARQELRREDLANWDASARSWLRSADRVKEKEQKQLLLIVNNVEIPVSTGNATYLSVITAWKAAMAGLESLVCGVPQRVQSGAVLLGLTAWHIFPDIVVLGKKLTEVRFGDSLVPPAGLLEIGLTKSNEESSRGVFWSLSLAHLRYYGTPVAVSGSATYDENRVSIKQLFIIALGSTAADWTLDTRDNTFEAILQTMEIIKSRLEGSSHEQMDAGSWLHGLLTASSAVQNSTGLDAKYASLLFSYGRHQGKALIQKTPNLFGLDKYSTLLAMARNQEDIIAVLRTLAESMHLSPKTFVIRYAHYNAKSKVRSYEYTSAVNRTNIRKRDREGQPINSEIWRWIESRNYKCASGDVLCAHCGEIIESEGTASAEERCREVGRGGETCSVLKLHIFCNEAETEPINTSNDRATRQKRGPGKTLILTTHAKSLIAQSYRSQTSWVDAIRHEDFELVFGDESAGLFLVSRLVSQDPFSRIRIPTNMSSTKAQHHIEHHVSTDNLFMYLKNPASWMDHEALQSLNALATAAFIYSSYPDATVPLRICSQPLNKASWCFSREKSSDRTLRSLTRAEIFSCLAYFESGTCDILPDALKVVMAMSTGDTIYISECLLSDPGVEHDHTTIRRVLGNVGRPGISMLVSPGTAQTRPQKIDSWMLIDPTPFDGSRVDNFQGTSMHLSFTGFELPIGNMPTGGRDVEAALVETVISVLDSGEWVADLDILSQRPPLGSCIFTDGIAGFNIFKKLPERQRFGDQMDCTHSDTFSTELSLRKFHSIDSWHGLLADLDSAGIVRSHGNKVARVAAAATNLFKGREVYVLPDDCCFECVAEFFGEEGFYVCSRSTVLIM